MFLILLSALCHSELVNYDLKSNFALTRAGDIGEWSILGVATNLKTSIHFAPNATSQKGAICHRLPSTAPSFVAEYAANIKKGSLLLSLTEECCPYTAISNNVMSWIGIVLNLTRKKEGILISTHHSSSNNPNYQQVDTILGNVTAQNISIKLIYNKDHVSILYKGDNDKTYIQIGQNVTIPEFKQVYFSFMASRNKNIGDLEIYSFQVDHGNHEESFNSKELSEQNRQLILIHQEKIKVAHKVLPLADAVIKEIEAANDDLTKGKNAESWEKIRGLLGEVRGRIDQTLNVKDLQKLVHATLAINLLKAEEKMEKRREEFSSIGEGLTDLKITVDEKLQWLSDYVLKAMADAKKQSLETMEEFLNFTNDVKILPIEAKKRAREAKQQMVPTFLYVIAIIEFACYVAFFFVRKKQTNNFKKFD